MRTGQVAEFVLHGQPSLARDIVGDSCGGVLCARVGRNNICDWHDRSRHIGR